MRAIHHAAQRNEARERIVDREVAKLELRQTRNRQFTTLATIDGYDVIDAATGRALDHRASLRSANGVAYRLNEAARSGPRALARALRAS